MAQHSRSAGFATSLIVGLLLIPVSAFAAYAIVSSSPAEPAPTTVAMTIPETTTSTVASTTTAVDTVVVEPVTATEADLERACGEDGLLLVEAEADGTITEVQQAALDALRQVCAESGIELPGPPEPEPIVRTVSVQVGGGETTGTYVGDDHAQYEDHDEYEDDGEYEDEDHDEYEHGDD